MFQPSLLKPSSFSVTEVTRYLRTLLESDAVLQDIWIAGEVSNISRPASGHIYFTLKDSAAAIKCVVWRSTVFRLPDMQVGSQIEAHGSVSVYERDGAYQLYVDAVRLRGEGELYQEFLRLKTRLEADGWFDEERKRSLPERPRTIGIVTSPTGAALQDMLNTLRGRYCLAEIVIAPAAVQGVEAPGEIVAAIRRLNEQVHPDVILVARGGGSMEDLWAFNDESVVRAVAESDAPVVTGIGHETDFTLADFAADVRAPTPTGAAVMATPSREDLLAELQAVLQDLNYELISRLETSHISLRQAHSRLDRESPIRRIERERQQVDGLAANVERGLRGRLQFFRMRLVNNASRLAILNPQAVLQRGYALVQLEDGTLVRSADQLAVNTRTVTRLARGSAVSRVESTRLD
ncbi:MAG: exodeoxyribonuclease VII large subunit [Leptolinea sp.]|jgi:exodeoxyribonuclease VII large subunit|nr:exodeoxyribonuclease VII large subunit [Leptolinea sp.]